MKQNQPKINRHNNNLNSRVGRIFTREQFDKFASKFPSVKTILKI